jgi:hypothetical protein
MEQHIMWLIVVLALLVSGVGVIYWLLKSMGESGIEAAAPGSCRSGRCRVTPQNSPDPGTASTPLAVMPADVLTNEVTRKDALSPGQTL